MNQEAQIRALKALTETASQYLKKKKDVINSKSWAWLCSCDFHNLSHALLLLMEKKARVALAKSPSLRLKQQHQQPLCLVFSLKALCLQPSAVLPSVSTSASAQPHHQDAAFQALCVTGMSLCTTRPSPGTGKLGGAPVPEPSCGYGRREWILSTQSKGQSPQVYALNLSDLNQEVSSLALLSWITFSSVSK